MTDAPVKGNPRRSIGVDVKFTDGEAALVGGQNQGVYALNATALALWELSDGDTTTAEMIDAICQVCDVPRATVEDDVERALHELAAAGLLEWPS